MRYVRIGLAVLAVAVFTGGYDLRAFKNFSSQEAMDSAQLARNISEGKGYTTLFIRPFSTYLIKQRYIAQFGQPDPGKIVDMAQVKGMHPDLANPPVYPYFLAGLMKVLPFRYPIVLTKPFWNLGGKFYRYEPDFLIALVNQALLYILVALVFFMARFLFDPAVAWLSAAVLFGTEIMWRFTVSGLSTTLLTLMFTCLVGCLALIEREGREPKWKGGAMLALAALAGGLSGVGGLTRYAFGWVILPVLAFLILFSGPRRVQLSLMAVFVFGAIMTPWVIRNYHVSGTPFGIAGYAPLELTAYFSEHHLQRALEPELNRISLLPLWFKLINNLRPILQSDLPRLGGSWISGFFLVGLMIGFRNLAIRRVRYFLMGCLGLFVVVQALGRTQLSEDMPEINSENLLVLVVPLALVYGVSLFYLLLEQIQMPVRELRYVVITLFAIASCLPMLMVFLPPKTIPVAYPPYHPQIIQQVAGWMQPKEMTMSDIPWAMAWYGERQSIWLTLNAQKDFFEVNDFIKPVSLLYLTPQTMDNRFVSQWIRPGEISWGNFVIQAVVRGKLPEGFPLIKTQSGWMPEQLILTDWERWGKPAK
jgi:hypothetical protein